MIVVKIEMHPGGDAKQARELGRVTITNMGTGNDRFGNYRVEKFGQRRQSLGNLAYVFNHARKSRTIFNLLRKALEALGV